MKKQKIKFQNAMFGFDINGNRVVVDYDHIKDNTYQVEIRYGNESNITRIRINQFANKSNALRLLKTYYQA